MYKELVSLIKCFAPENRVYWINALKVSESIKGYLYLTTLEA